MDQWIPGQYRFIVRDKTRYNDIQRDTTSHNKFLFRYFKGTASNSCKVSLTKLVENMFCSTNFYEYKIKLIKFVSFNKKYYNARKIIKKFTNNYSGKMTDRIGP